MVVGAWGLRKGAGRMCVRVGVGGGVGRAPPCNPPTPPTPTLLTLPPRVGRGARGRRLAPHAPRPPGKICAPRPAPPCALGRPSQGLGSRPSPFRSGPHPRRQASWRTSISFTPNLRLLPDPVRLGHAYHADCRLPGPARSPLRWRSLCSPLRLKCLSKLLPPVQRRCAACRVQISSK